MVNQIKKTVRLNGHTTSLAPEKEFWKELNIIANDQSLSIEHCLNELNKMDLEIYNIDTTIICENPKINPHREKILENLSAILKVPMKKIGLKATTSEKIGIIGNNEAISVQSIVNLKDLS